MRKINRRAVDLFRQLRALENECGPNRDVWPDGARCHYDDLELALHRVLNILDGYWNIYGRVTEATEPTPPPHLFHEDKSQLLMAWRTAREIRVKLEQELVAK